MIRHYTSAAVVAIAFMAGSAASAQADVSKGVISAFRGQLVVTKDELPTGKNDKDTIAQIKAARAHDARRERRRKMSRTGTSTTPRS